MKPGSGKDVKLAGKSLQKAGKRRDKNKTPFLFALCYLFYLHMPQKILHHVQNNFISCFNVTYLFPVFAHSDSAFGVNSHQRGKRLST